MIETRKSEKTAYLLDLLPKVSKGAAIAGTICGFFYLLAYTRDVGIPFPLQLSVLPLTLLVVGLSAFGGVVILIGGVMIPAIFADDPLATAKEYLLARNVILNRLRVRFVRWLGCFMVPMLLSLSSVTVWIIRDKDSFSWLPVLGWILILAAIFWVILTPWFIEPLRSKWGRYSFSTLFQTLLAVWAYGVLILLIIAIEPSIGKWPAWQGCAVALMIFSPIYFFSTFPPEGPSAIILLPPKFEYKTTTSTAVAFTFAVFIAVLSVFNYPANARIGGAVLKLFGIGGKMPIVICLKPASANVSKYITVDQSNCATDLFLLFDGGDHLYVAPKPKEGNTDKNKNVPIGIRQDDISIKIYPHI
jgi:hypothetical protein